MLVNKGKSYLEYISILFFALSLLYVSYACCKKIFFHNNYVTTCEEFFKNFDIYKSLLQKYDANLLDIKIVDGYVEASIEKNSFNKESFIKNEPYLIEEIDDNKYVVTFKSTNMCYKHITTNQIDKNDNYEELNIESFSYVDPKNWSLTINGIIYDQSNKIIDKNCKIKSVNNDKIILDINKEEKIFIV